MARIQDETVRRKMLLNDQFALTQLLSPETNAHNIHLKILDEAWNFCGTFAGKSLNRPIHVDHGLHLKADVFTRKDHNPKPESLGQLTSNLITNMARAQVELKHGSPEATSLTILDEAIRSIPNQSLVLVPLAREMIRLGRPSDAQQFAERAILSDPDCYPAFVELAHALLNQGDLGAAAKCVERCRSRFPHKLGIWGLAHVIHGQCGAVDSTIARPDYDKFLTTTRVQFSQALDKQLQNFILQQQRLETQRPAGVPDQFYRSAALGRLAGPSIAAFKNVIREHLGQYQGMLLMFPAHYWHGTIPHASDESRISFGFNVLQASSQSTDR
jgi:tetratricopeptide (TPR) repeat protein